MLRICLIALSLLTSVSLAWSQDVHEDNQPILTADSQRQEGVPRGKIVAMEPWKSKVFPGTERDWWIYVPAQYDGQTPAAVAIFQDGGKARPEDPKFTGPNHSTVVFDNLIHRKEMPVTIGIYLSPGVYPDPKAPKDKKPRSNRMYEYDTPDDRYARFLLEEILPEVSKQYRLTEKAEERLLVGASSGGLCAFTAAWHRPDQFQKVISHVGSFVDHVGGYIYPPLIRKTHLKWANRFYPTPEAQALLQQRRKLKVFLQDGYNDLDNIAGNWPLANQDMAAAMKFAGWDHQLIMGQGGHNSRHGTRIFPDTLRWIWAETLSN